MATVRKLFPDEEVREFDAFLRQNGISCELVDDPEEQRVYFYFRTRVKAVVDENKIEPLGDRLFIIPRYELRLIQCSISYTILDFRDRRSKDIIDEIRMFVTEQFHLDEDEFCIGLEKCRH